MHGEFAQRQGDGRDVLVVLVEAIGVGGGEPGDFPARLVRVPGEEQVVALQQADGAGGPLDDLEAVAVQFQVADDFRVQQAHRVGVDGIPEARVEFLGDRGATDHRAAFEYLDAQARAGQVAGAGEPVVARADDDCIMVCQCSMPPPGERPARCPGRRFAGAMQYNRGSRPGCLGWCGPAD